MSDADRLRAAADALAGWTVLYADTPGAQRDAAIAAVLVAVANQRRPVPVALTKWQWDEWDAVRTAAESLADSILESVE